MSVLHCHWEFSESYCFCTTYVCVFSKRNIAVRTYIVCITSQFIHAINCCVILACKANFDVIVFFDHWADGFRSPFLL